LASCSTLGVKQFRTDCFDRCHPNADVGYNCRPGLAFIKQAPLMWVVRLLGNINFMVIPSHRRRNQSLDRTSTEGTDKAEQDMVERVFRLGEIALLVRR